MAINIVTDSTSYIPKDLREELGITVVSLAVNFRTESYLEEEIDNTTFYDKMNKSPVIPTSSQPALHDIYEAFVQPAADGNPVVGIFLSSEMSGTYATAVSARDMVWEKYPEAQIEIVDSRSNCMELGFAVLAAARAAQAGREMEEVLAQTRDVMACSRFLFVPESLEYLKKGGRIGGASALLGSVLQIKPILTVIDGKTALLTKVRQQERAVQKIVDTALEDIERLGLGDIAVHHISCEAEGKKVSAVLEKALSRQVPVYPIGPVIGLHVGPGTLGIVYYTKAERNA